MTSHHLAGKAYGSTNYKSFILLNCFVGIETAGIKDPEGHTKNPRPFKDRKNKEQHRNQ